jgi:hypothetical protein
VLLAVPDRSPRSAPTKPASEPAGRAAFRALGIARLANGGTAPLWSRTSSYGTSDVSVHSRESANSAWPPQGCSHKGFTAVVIVVSGAATLEVGGTSKAAAADKFGGQLAQGGESHRISQGDVFIMPPDTIHWYKDVATPFRYIEVPVP